MIWKQAGHLEADIRRSRDMLSQHRTTEQLSRWAAEKQRMVSNANSKRRTDHEPFGQGAQSMRPKLWTTTLRLKWLAGDPGSLFKATEWTKNDSSSSKLSTRHETSMKRKVPLKVRKTIKNCANEVPEGNSKTFASAMCNAGLKSWAKAFMIALPSTR